MTDLPTRLRRQVPGARVTTAESTVRVEYLAGLLALLPAVGILLVRVAINLPSAPEFPYGALYDPLATLALLGPAVGAILLGLTTQNSLVRVATTTAGVFGLLAHVVEPAVVPAAVGMVGATGLLVVAHAKRPLSANDVAETLVGLAFLAGIAIALAGSLGIEPAMTRRVGSTVGLLAIAGTPVFVPWDRRTIVVGLLAGVAVAAFGLSAPFVTGAASLIGGGILGVSLPVLVLAVVGGVTLTATGVVRGRPGLVLAGALLLAGGVPATVPRALTTVLAVTFLLAPEPPR